MYWVIKIFHFLLQGFCGAIKGHRMFVVNGCLHEGFLDAVLNAPRFKGGDQPGCDTPALKRRIDRKVIDVYEGLFGIILTDHIGRQTSGYPATFGRSQSDEFIAFDQPGEMLPRRQGKILHPESLGKELYDRCKAVYIIRGQFLYFYIGHNQRD